MVIDMNESNLETIEQIREFLAGTSEVAFSIPADESKLRAFVATVIRRWRYFSRAKAQRGVLFAYMPFIEAHRRFIARWSCSIRLFRYFELHALTCRQTALPGSQRVGFKSRSSSSASSIPTESGSSYSTS